MKIELHTLTEEEGARRDNGRIISSLILLFVMTGLFIWYMTSRNGDRRGPLRLSDEEMKGVIKWAEDMKFDEQPSARPSNAQR